MTPRHLALLAACAVAFTACARHGSQQPQQPVASRGAALYAQNCAACHGDRGIGPIGPSLVNEKARKGLEQVKAVIANPDPPMPKLFPQPLTDADVADIAAFVETL